MTFALLLITLLSRMPCWSPMPCLSAAADIAGIARTSTVEDEQLANAPPTAPSSAPPTNDGGTRYVYAAVVGGVLVGIIIGYVRKKQGR